MVHSEVSVAQDLWPSEVTWELTCDGLDAPIEGGAPYAATHALPLGASCALKMVDAYGDGWQGAYWSAPAWTGNESYSLGTFLQVCPNGWVVAGDHCDQSYPYGGVLQTASFTVTLQPPSPPPSPGEPPAAPSAPPVTARSFYLGVGDLQGRQRGVPVVGSTGKTLPLPRHGGGVCAAVRGDARMRVLCLRHACIAARN